MHGFTGRIADRIRANWKISTAALLAAALVGAATPSSAFFDRPASDAPAHHRVHAPSGANVVGRGIAGQHDRFGTNASAGIYADDGDAPFGANVIGRGIAGFHSRL